MALSIRALGMGRLVGLHKPAITYMRHWGDTHTSPLIMFVIEGGAHPVVVDTGPLDPEHVWQHHRYRMEQSAAERPANVLAAAGIDPLSVRWVVNTHLHWDHSSNNDLFPNARVVVQQRELDYAREPLQWHRVAFEHLPEITAPWRKAEDRIEAVDGDRELVPGVSVVALPGHTPGSQGVLVQAAERKYLIAGDCVDTYENWDGDEAASHIPSGLYTNLHEYDASFTKIESLDCEVIPSHDAEVLERGTFA
jgi:glyoxylase-like metal-dependent hydrolase (beta-lactamase superfamily II)